MNEQILFDSAPHRLLIPDGTGQWSLWRDVCLRGAGFPIDDVLQLASPRSAKAADDLHAAEDAAEEARSEALEKVELLLREAEGSAVSELAKAVQKLKKGQLPRIVPEIMPAAAQPGIERFAAALDRVRSAAEEYLAAFAAEASRLSGVIRDAARGERFREAVLWQNRRVLRTGIDSLLRPENAGKRTSKDRQNEQVIASYLQRFCTKNDTIGFFGPVGWATLRGEGGEAIRVRHRPDLLAERRVYFEGWCIDAVADQICAGLEVPLALEPDRALQEQIELLGDDGAREEALRQLGELEEDRRAVSRAAGDPVALDRALAGLESRFTELTGRDSTRGHGQTYAGRTLVYEDCRRSTEVDLGPAFLAQLATPLSLLLESARWLTFASAERHRELYRQTYEDLRQETGATGVDLAVFCRRILPVILSLRTSPVRQEIVPRFQEKWSEILDLPEGASRVSYTSEELRPRVLQAFAAPQPGWTMARYHSPDVMIVADGPEAIRRGDYELVLGEIHVGSNTLGTNLFMARHPTPEVLLAAYEQDVPEPCIIPILPKLWRQEETDVQLGLNLPGTTGRLEFGLMTAKDFRLEIATASPMLQGPRALPIADLVIEDGGAGLEVVDRKDGSRRFDLLDFLQMAMTAQTIGAFKLLGSRPHSPRITVDRLIISRESWRCETAGMEFTRAATEAERFAGARRWADSLGMPRFLFARTPLERKPFYLDLDSPVSIEIFAKEVRQAFAATSGKASVRLSEMLPGLDGSWLADAQGRRYTSELRFVAVDRAG